MQFEQRSLLLKFYLFDVSNNYSTSNFEVVNLTTKTLINISKAPDQFKVSKLNHFGQFGNWNSLTLTH